MSALYLALTIEGMFAEMSHGFAHRFDPLTVCTYEVDVDDIVDLRTNEARKGEGVTLADMDCAWMHDVANGRQPVSWRLASRFINDGVAGILVPSFALGYRHIKRTPEDRSNVPGLPGADIAYDELPYNMEAEQALLGTILVDNAAYKRAAGILEPAHFADPLHGKLYDVLSRRIENSQPVTAAEFRAYAEQDEDLKAAGGAAYLARLAAASVRAIDPAAFGETIRALYLRRQDIDADKANLVLWRWAPDLPHRVNVYDPSGRLPRNQTSWS